MHNHARLAVDHCQILLCLYSIRTSALPIHNSNLVNQSHTHVPAPATPTVLSSVEYTTSSSSASGSIAPRAFPTSPTTTLLSPGPSDPSGQYVTSQAPPASPALVQVKCQLHLGDQRYVYRTQNRVPVRQVEPRCFAAALCLRLIQEFWLLLMFVVIILVLWRRRRRRRGGGSPEFRIQFRLLTRISSSIVVTVAQIMSFRRPILTPDGSSSSSMNCLRPFLVNKSPS
ncbi:hypothetical protein PCASD_21211 [Puccinia coronata f. sp. avenae]|uniref:Uncharacterized protein n=1 Tax=Puccinia coronata f. sp. avenae TaxID=200324 RepID=A0A2N5SAM2_9BASI|nr:hypothetical protein PCASD_21211 [Puccinia coronata f. sp. avenae]